MAISEESMEPTGSARSGKFAERLLNVFPILPFLAFGFFLAWSQVCMPGVLVLPQADPEAGLLPLRSISSLANGITLVCVGFAATRAGKLLEKSRFVILCGILVGAASLVPLILADTGMTYEQAYPLWLAAEIVRGVASAFIFLKIARLYSRLSGRACIMYLGFSHIMAACLFYIFIGSDVAAVGTSQNTLAMWLGNALLPLLAAMTATLEPPANITVYRRDDVHSGEIETLPSSFWRFVVIIFVLSLVMALTSSAGAGSGGASGSPRLLNVIRIVCALVIVWSAMSFSSERFKLGKTYVWLIVFAIAIVALTPVVSGLVSGWAILSSACMLLFRMLHWVVLCLIVCQRRISSLVVFGFGAGVQALGSGLGGILPILLNLPTDTTSSLILAIVCIMLVIACAFLLFSEKEMDLLFKPANADDEEYRDLFGPIVTDRVVAEDVREISEEPAPVVKDGEDEDERRSEAPLPDSVPPASEATPTASEDADEQPRRYHRSFNEAIDICAKRYQLSSREIDVFRYLAMGYNAQAIADKLYISWNTVRSHSRNIYAKLDAHTRSELMDMVTAVREE